MTMALRRVIAGLCLTLLGLILWGRGFYLANLLMSVPQGYRLLYQKEQTLKTDAFPGAPDTEYHYAAVNQQMDQWVKAMQFGRERSVTLLEIAGDPALALPQHQMVLGGFPLDSLGCAIDEESALTLWGDPDVLGKTVLCDDREYQVTGVFRASTPMMVRRPAGDMSFRHAYFLAPSHEAFPLRALDNFLVGEQLAQPDVVQDTAVSARFYRQLSLLPLFLPCAVLLWHILKGWLPRQKGSPRLLWLAGMAATAYVLGFRLSVPVDYLPTRWSDVSFWPALLERLQTRQMLLWSQPGLISEFLLRQDYLTPIIACWLFSLGCLGLGILILSRLYYE